jgi:hypothetical protein
MKVATAAENTTAALLGTALVMGIYADGWAHLNLGGLDSFFTPWHGASYGAFTLLTAWLAWMVWRRRGAARGGQGPVTVPAGYGWGAAGVAVFAVGGLLDMAWHLVFGIEVGLDALVSPTHLLLMTGAVLLVTSPLRAAAPRPLNGAQVHRWPAVVSIASATALVGFFLAYLSVFADPGAREPLIDLPEGGPGHRAGELPAIAGLGGYLVSTVLLVVPLLFLRRRGRLPHGTVTTLVGAVALPAAALSQLVFAIPALGALAGAVVVDLVLLRRPNMSPTAFAVLLPALVWAGQLAGLAGLGELRWPVELWSGVILLSVGLAVGLTRLTSTPTATAPAETEGPLTATVPGYPAGPAAAQGTRLR